MANKLHEAKKNKNDEWYTQYHDIEREMNAYIEYNPDVFRGKVILCPCDDPAWSNFTKYFAQNFSAFGLRKLICTSYAGSLHEETEYEKTSPQYDAELSKTHGKLFILEEDLTRDGIASFDDFRWTYLEGDGDFRSDEVKTLRDESDFIITNPPFSLFREFLAWIIEGEKSFITLGPMNAITYKEVFPYIKENKLWLGTKPMGVDSLFMVPEQYKEWLVNEKKEGSGYKIINGEVLGRAQTCWYTNIDHGKRHQPLVLMTMEENLRHSSHDLEGAQCYQKYDNYDAIEVKWVDAIPNDYEELIGVPISFLEKHCPEQFKIIGLLQSSSDEQAGTPNLRYYNDFKEMTQEMTYTGASGKKANGNPVMPGKSLKGNFLYNPETDEYVHSVYARIVIKKI